MSSCSCGAPVGVFLSRWSSVNKASGCVRSKNSRGLLSANATLCSSRPPLRARRSNRNFSSNGVRDSFVVHAESPVAGWEDGGVSDGTPDDYVFAVLGDLHLDPNNMPIFQEAQSQVLDVFSQKNGLPKTSRLFQVGDLGGYSARPGSQECFDRALDFVDSFGVPRALVLGNHDLEGAEFDTDQENLNAWKATFGQRHYWVVEHGATVCIGLSTVRFRSAKYSCHEVFVDPEQVTWFKNMLAKYSDRNVFVFTHAPPMGSGLKVLQEIHVKNRCAWLNHSEEPSKFIDLVSENPQVKLWFSGHFHLSHNYEDSISVVGGCAFVQVGVIGDDSSRDGFRHSRILKGNSDGYEVHTLDHSTGELRLDLAHNYSSVDPPKPLPLPPREELLCNPEYGFLCAVDDCDLEGEHSQWFPAGLKSLMSVQQNMMIEYDPATRSPLGVVSLCVDDRKIQLVDENGGIVSGCDSDNIEDGEAAVAVELIDANGQKERRLRNEYGGFSQIFQKNKWVARKLKEKQAAAT
ncbi:hypothetical protein BSKO_11652 [Bryopsis sp. KO-2023]|nr:hypothetical protein BSKO_11652 [Bryopsis sp. KO-2023]